MNIKYCEKIDILRINRIIIDCNCHYNLENIKQQKVTMTLTSLQDYFDKSQLHFQVF